VITEGALALLIVSPVAQRWTRRVALALCLGLHGGIALLMELGPFSYAMMCIALLLLRPADWDAVGGFLRPRFGAWKVRAAVRLRSVVGPQTAPGEYAPDPRAVPPPPSALAGAARAGLRDAATILLATCMAVQLLHDNWILPGSLRIANRPEFVGLVIDYLRIPQGWMMFAPEAPRDDGTLVVDGVLADDTHVDPFTGRAPDFEQALHGPLDYGQSWCDYFLRISWDDNRRYWPYLRDYLLRAQRVGLKVATPLKRFDVYWVSNQAPQPGSVTPHDLRRKLLFSGNARGGRR
jgi:hypothetical protein